jgi:HEAT repeat protein
MSDVDAAKLRERSLELLATLAVSGRPEVRANALEALVQAPARLKQVAPAALADSNVGVRTVAAMAVGKARLGELTPQVEPLLRDESPLARSAAIFAARRCGSGVDPSPLAQLLFSDPSPKVRSHVAYILGELGDRSAVGMLREAARSSLPRALPSEVRILRLQLAEARVKLGDETAIAEIRATLYPARPEDLEVTALAVQVIGTTQDKGAMDQLIFITARRNEQGQLFPAEIRLAAAGAVAELGNSKGGFIAEEYITNPAETLRAQAAYVLGQTGRPEHLPTLERLLDDPDARVRVSAAAAIVRITQRLADRRALER